MARAMDLGAVRMPGDPAVTAVEPYVCGRRPGWAYDHVHRWEAPLNPRMHHADLHAIDRLPAELVGVQQAPRRDDLAVASLERADLPHVPEPQD